MTRLSRLGRGANIFASSLRIPKVYPSYSRSVYDFLLGPWRARLIKVFQPRYGVGHINLCWIKPHTEHERRW